MKVYDKNEICLYHGDARDMLFRNVKKGSVDLVLTDPPYGYGFMNQSWDRVLPPVEIWFECSRILKPGGWCLVMSAPRADVLSRMITNLEQAGFWLNFTPIFWTYATGFPKGADISKLIDKRAGAERKKVRKSRDSSNRSSGYDPAGKRSGGSFVPKNEGERFVTAPETDEAKRFAGAYAGFQPKPAVEIIIVAMKPLEKGTYVDQALENGRGVTWLDDCRIPIEDRTDIEAKNPHTMRDPEQTIFGKGSDQSSYDVPDGRVPANLLVSNDTLGSYSEYFDLDVWDRSTFPFVMCPKPAPAEKTAGLEGRSEKRTTGGGGQGKTDPDLREAARKYGSRKAASQNYHPTVKPVKLMRYLITLTTRPGDLVVDPFMGSGTTGVAAAELDREFVGIDREKEYVDIAAGRIDVPKQADLFERGPE